MVPINHCFDETSDDFFRTEPRDTRIRETVFPNDFPLSPLFLTARPNLSVPFDARQRVLKTTPSL